jgi:hypothetical protein
MFDKIASFHAHFKPPQISEDFSYASGAYCGMLVRKFHNAWDNIFREGQDQNAPITPLTGTQRGVTKLATAGIVGLALFAECAYLATALAVVANVAISRSNLRAYTAGYDNAYGQPVVK